MILGQRQEIRLRQADGEVIDGFIGFQHVGAAIDFPRYRALLALRAVNQDGEEVVAVHKFDILEKKTPLRADGPEVDEVAVAV